MAKPSQPHPEFGCHTADRPVWINDADSIGIDCPENSQTGGRPLFRLVSQLEDEPSARGG
jgi:hypothetical protein